MDTTFRPSRVRPGESVKFIASLSVYEVAFYDKNDCTPFQRDQTESYDSIGLWRVRPGSTPWDKGEGSTSIVLPTPEYSNFTHTTAPCPDGTFAEKATTPIPGSATANLEPGCYQGAATNSGIWFRGVGTGGTLGTLTVGKGQCAQKVREVPIDVSVDGPGSVFGAGAHIDCGSVCSDRVPVGSRVTLLALPGEVDCEADPRFDGAVRQTAEEAELYGPLVCETEFHGWAGGGCSPFPDVCTVEMTTARTVHADFGLTVGRGRFSRKQKHKFADAANRIRAMLDDYTASEGQTAPPRSSGGQLVVDADHLRELIRQLDRLAADPPDKRFRAFPSLKQPKPLSVPSDGLSRRAHKRLVALAKAEAQAVGYAGLVLTSVERAEGARVAEERDFERRQMHAAAGWAKRERATIAKVLTLRHGVRSALAGTNLKQLSRTLPGPIRGTVLTLKKRAVARQLETTARTMRAFAHFAKAKPLDTAPGY